jgi:uracil-DNA glycosylase
MFRTLPSSWANAIGSAPLVELSRIEASLSAMEPFYPSWENVLRAFEFAETEFHAVKLVILGHDPYTREGQADGLAFSVPAGIKHPHSLRCIFREVARNGGASVPPDAGGDLTRWAEEGVLLLNTSLTVAPLSSGSHRKLDWDGFTGPCLRALSQEREGLVFMLWGNHARSKGRLIDGDRHLRLEAGHPAAGRCADPRFKNSCHFSEANRYLRSRGKAEIHW